MIKLYVHFVVYVFWYEFSIIVVVCGVQSSYPVNMVFNLPALFGRLVAEFEYTV